MTPQQTDLFKPLTRDQRQNQGIVKWLKNRCIGTLEYPTGVGSLKYLRYHKYLVKY